MDTSKKEYPESISIADLDVKEVENSPLDNVPPDEKPVVPPPKDHLPPNTIYITGVINAIEDSGSYGYDKSNCGEKPCFARILVQNLIQTGMGVTVSPTSQEEITLFFPSSLDGFNYGKTKMEPLEKNDRFSGIIAVDESNAEWADEGISYTIQRYKKL